MVLIWHREQKTLQHHCRKGEPPAAAPHGSHRGSVLKVYPKSRDENPTDQTFQVFFVWEGVQVFFWGGWGVAFQNSMFPTITDLKMAHLETKLKVSAYFQWRACC